MGARDLLLVRGMQFFGRHGVHAAEQTLGQRFTVCVEAGARLAAAGASDRVEDTVSYVRLFEIAKAVVEGPPRQLVEAVAADIARDVLRIDGIQHVRVRVVKPCVALPAVLDGVGVEIFREKGAG